MEFATGADRERWAAVIKVTQRLLPSDPDCPGITALTSTVAHADDAAATTTDAPAQSSADPTAAQTPATPPDASTPPAFSANAIAFVKIPCF